MNTSVFGMRMSTGILRCPSGRYVVVGSVPAACCGPDGRQKVYETEDACAAAIRAAGVTRFQMADCSWSTP